MSTEVLDADIVPEGQERETSQALTATPEVATLSVTTPVQASDLVERLDKIREAMDNAMQVDVDYGKIPGTDKPTLYKPGAEKLAVMFRLDVQTTHDEKWGPGDHLTVPAYTTIYDAPTGIRLGRGEGLCSTRERKYAYRKQDRTCPTCEKPAILRSKKEGEGWFCWRKRGGCGTNFPVDDERITTQQEGDVDNPDLPDLWNTVIKMARKRAIVDAVLLVTGASALFTQDIEDQDQSSGKSAVEQGPQFGPEKTDRRLRETRAAIAYILKEDDAASEKVTEVLREIAKEHANYLPEACCAAICRTARMLRDGTAVAVEAEQAAADDPLAEEFTRPLGDTQ